MPRQVRLGLILLPLVAGLAIGGWFAFRPAPPGDATDTATDPGQPPAAVAAGKLVVLVVFDQLRGDYLDRWAAHFGPDGFERLKKDGVWFSACHLPYACSSTGPGHASIATGVPPSVHGIVENEWYDRSRATRVFGVRADRPYARVPPLRGADRDEPGLYPERVLAPTVGDALLAARGDKGRVFSLSLKDRAAVLMGGKKPTGMYCFDTRDGRFHTSAYYRDTAPPWVEEFNTSGLVNKWFGTTWDVSRPDLDYAKLVGSDSAPGEGFGVGQGRVFPHPFAPKSPAPEEAYYAALEYSPAGNELLLAFAKKAVTAERLGQDGRTDLLCVSFSSNDLVGHEWGPDSWEVFDITLRSDRLIAELVKFLDESVGKDRYTLVVTADHGVCPLPESGKVPGARRVGGGELFPPLVAALNETFGQPPGPPDVWFEPGVSANRVWPWVYLNHAMLKARGLPVEDVADFAAQWLGNRPFMETAFTRRQILTGTFPPGSLGARVRQAYHPDRCGDLLVVPKPGVLAFGGGTGTNHGSPHPYDTHVPLLVYGAGVPAAGKRTEAISSLVVAPTLAKALGIPPPAGVVERPIMDGSGK